MVTSFNQIFEVRTTTVSCLFVRVADTLIKQLPRAKAQVSSDYSTAADPSNDHRQTYGESGERAFRGNTSSQVLVELLKCCRINTTRTTVLSKERSLRIQFSCREKRDVNFPKWPIACNPSESAHWSTKVIRQSAF